jgi:2,4-dienoyl-CoA reductase (NADPH2)
MGLLTGRLTKRKGLWQNFLWRAGLLAFKYFYSLPLLRWALGSNFLFGKSIAIIGGGFAACELAEFMIDHGKQVTIITESKRVGEDIGPSTRWVLMMKLRKAQIKILNEAKVVEITKKGVKVNRNGAVELVQADTIVPALGMKETTELAKLLAGKAPAVYSVGDCVEPRKIAEAVKAGYRLGREL